jgi:hypothetical protein
LSVDTLSTRVVFVVVLVSSLGLDRLVGPSTEALRLPTDACAPYDHHCWIWIVDVKIRCASEK